MDVNLINTVKKFKLFGKTTCEDFVDRLNFQVTPLLLLFFVTLVGYRQYIFNPIQCWTPKEVDRAREQYVENYCWVESTYTHPYPSTGRTLGAAHEREDNKLMYYQWIPFILVLMAVFFYLPRMIWVFLSSRSGADINAAIQFASEAAVATDQRRDNIIKFLSGHIDRMCHIRRDYKSSKWVKVRKVTQSKLPFLCWSKRTGYFVFLTYVLAKLLYVVNGCGQIFLMQYLLSFNNTYWGAKILLDLHNNRSWHITKVFPRVTFCDIKVENLGQPQTYSVQCVLPVNMLNEMIFIFLWFWIVVLIVVTFLSLLGWMISLTLMRNKTNFIAKYLHLMIRLRKRDRPELARQWLCLIIKPVSQLSKPASALESGAALCAGVLGQRWNFHTADDQTQCRRYNNSGHYSSHVVYI